MEMKMLLLLPAVVLLVSLAVATPHRLNQNLNRIIEAAEKYNESSTKDFFVEDVSHLAQGSNKCKDAFFCKVYTILKEHEHFGKRKDEKELVREMEMFIEQKNMNCTEVLKNVKPTGVSKPIPDLVKYLVDCIKSKNLNNDNN